MTPEQLKSSILQYAIQGKLVEQRAEEGTGEELFQKIKRKREVLIKEKIIKKDKRTNSTINSREVPFDIPENWMWVTLGSILNKLTDGTHRTPKYTSTGVKFVSVKDMSNGFLSLENTKFISEEEHKELFARCNPEKGDLILSKVGTTGVPAIVDTTEPFSLFVSVALLKFDCECVDVEFLYYMLMSPLVQAQATENTRGVGNKNWVLDAIASTMVVFPPLSEQKRIVKKLKELLPYVDRYAASYEKLEQFNAKFPEDMKRSILQYAIQGKLVEQRPEEGTGEELYQQIQAKKQRLVKEGKIKKEKPLPEITEDEVPFDIPESWKWVRLSQLAILENGDRSSKYPVESDYVDFGIPFFGAKDMNGSAMSLENVRYISEKKFSELGNGKLKNKDFICLLRGSVGKCAAFIADEKHRTGFICAQMVIVRCIDKAICDYMQKFLMSPFYSQYIESKVTGTAVRQLPAKELGNVLVPLPPLAEQTRIVAKLEELLPLCERLK